MEILHRKKLEAEVRKLLSEGEWAEIAVAYWGKGATKRLIPPSRNASNTLIVCDFMSGACNPDEIKILIKRFGNLNRKKDGPFKGVGKLDRLHAKVWLTDKGAILGSSNASSNGLGEENKELSGSIEANIRLDDRPTLNSIEQWFTENITPEPITKRDIERVIAVRKTLPRKRLPDGGSLLSALRDNPSDFDSDKLFVWIWQYGKFDKETINALEKEEEIREDRGIDCWEDPNRLDPGSFVVHINMSKGKVRDISLNRVLLEDEYIRVGSKMLLLCKIAPSFRELPLGDKHQWSEAALRAMKSGRSFVEMRASDFTRKYLA